MNVYIVWKSCFNGCDSFESIVEIFTDEMKAELLAQELGEKLPVESREYISYYHQKFEVNTDKLYAEAEKAT